MLWFEYSLSVTGTVLTVTIRWYTVAVAGTPVHTDTMPYDLTDAQVTPELIESQFRNRADVIKRALATYTAINTAFSGGQNVRLEVQ